MDTTYLATVALIVAAGLVMLSSATGPVAYAKFQSSFWFVEHQLLYGLLPGLVLFLFFSRLPYARLSGHPIVWYLATLALLMSVFIPGLGAVWGKTRSWIAVAGFSLQPAEIAKLTFSLFLASWFARSAERSVAPRAQFLFFILLLGGVVALLAAEPDVGMLCIVSAIAVTMYFVAGAPLGYLAVLFIFGAGGIYGMIRAAPYRAARLLTFLHPELDPQGIGYHINQALLAVGSGGWWGLGYGHSRQKFLYLPEAAGDSIFAVIAEEMGFVLSAAFIVLFVILTIRGIRIASRAPDRFGLLLAAGITAWFGIQAAVNIGSMLGLLPLTGLTMPFVSYGGTSLMTSLAAAGIMASISRKN